MYENPVADKPDNPDELPLDCRRYAPRPVSLVDEFAETEWAWPMVWQEDTWWCGEWEPIRSETKNEETKTGTDKV